MNNATLPEEGDTAPRKPQPADKKLYPTSVNQPVTGQRAH